MESFLSRYRNLLVLVLVLVAQIIGLAVQVRTPSGNRRDGSEVRLLRSWSVHLIAIPERILHATVGGIGGLWTSYLDLRGVRARNADLTAQVGRLQLEQATLLEDARQGQRLQKLLQFREHYIYQTVPAQVIGTSGTDQSRVLYIDKGSADGLKPDMAVVTPDGIVGKLRDVFRHTSQVLEISDQSSGAGVILVTTRLQGVLRGNAVGQPEIINLLPDERVKPGEHVITSGGDQIFPRGLPVGVVDRIVPDVDRPPYVDILIKPAAQLGHIEEVLVITSTSGQMTAGARRDIAQSVKAAAAAESAAEAAAEAVAAQNSHARTADILAERLPGLSLQPNDPNSPAASTEVPPPVVAPLPLHSDRFTPGATPPAADLVPGKQFTPLAVSTAAPTPTGAAYTVAGRQGGRRSAGAAGSTGAASAGGSTTRQRSVVKQPVRPLPSNRYANPQAEAVP